MSEQTLPILRASYRLQLTPDFGFAAATALVPQIAALGMSHLYLSPILEAATGSTHGYDVVDHGSVREAFGGRAGLEQLVRALRTHGMGILVDIVPNHMSIADVRNRWWWDVLENGPSARTAIAFDVDWDSPEAKLKNIVLVPILGDHHANVLARREISVQREGARFVVRYFDHRLPVAPRLVGALLQKAHSGLGSDRLAFLADAYAELPLPTMLDQTNIERRHRDRAVLGELLRELIENDPAIARAIDEAAAALSNDEEALDAFLERQNYRLAYWRSADRDLDYRRFFDVNTLVGLHVEDERVFRATHDFIGELCKAALLDGVRVDHVDGLADPAGYLARLRELVGPRSIFVEKILGDDEAMPRWPIEGTTGYEFIRDLTTVFVDPAGERPLTDLAHELTSETRNFEAIASEARQQVMRDVLDSDLNRLVQLATSLRERHHVARDFSRHDFHEAMRALLACFPTYRSYVVPERDEVNATDAAELAEAIDRAKRIVPEVEAALFEFLADVLLLRRRGDVESELVRRFQQLTPPAMAKGVEDTAFYRDPRLLALDEVGGDPRRFSLAPSEFHARCRQALEQWPNRMLATSTHDTKRSEDARARLVVLTEDHVAFAELARSFFARAERYRVGNSPDGVTTMIALQSLLAAWPIGIDRFKAFLQKAAREAKRQTSWSRQDTAYEAGLVAFAEHVLADADLVYQLGAYVSRIEPAARAISLGWTLLKITCPGMPDFYQGTERWDHSLVDPDNRRPVDWATSAKLLASTEQPPLADDHLGATKLQVVRTALTHRKTHPASFAAGSRYEPVTITDRNLLAFSRSADGEGTTVVVVTLRPMAKRGAARIALPRGQFRNLLTKSSPLEGDVETSAVLGTLPIALLHAE